MMNINKRNRQTQNPRGSENPQQLSSNVRIKHRFRFIATSAVNTTFTDTQILGCTGGICTVTNSTVTLWTQSFKIRRLEVWSAPSAQGQGSTCSVEWFGAANSPNIEYSDTTLSVSKNAHICTSPPDRSLASFWQKSTSTALFTIVAPASSIIDIALDFILGDDDTTPYSASVTTGVLGQEYYLHLDGPSIHNCVPVSLTTTH
jgi:hypothetical protein